MHITEQFGGEALKPKIIIPQLFRIHRNAKGSPGLATECGIEFPAHIIWIVRDREASADDGIHVSSGVESLAEMGINFQDRLFQSVQEGSQEWKGLMFVWPKADKALSEVF